MCGWVKLAWCLASQNHVIKIWYIFLRCQFNLKNKIEKRCHIFTRGTDGYRMYENSDFSGYTEMMRDS